MTSPIDPLRRAAKARRARKSDVEDSRAAAETSAAEDRNLPVPVEPVARTVPPEPPVAAASVFAAQLLGQDGQKRGLKGGAPVLDSARAAYNQTEWSGQADRRARKGRNTKTEI